MRLVMALAVLVAVAGCGTVSSLSNGVSNPMTPEESKAQVVDAARQIVQTLGLQDASATFKRRACNDQAEPPFRGEVRVDYAHPSTFEASEADVATMLDKLQASGWSSDTDFASHGRVVRKDGVDAEFVPYHPNDTVGGITLYGECRDMTSSDNTMPEPVSLGGAQ